MVFRVAGVQWICSEVSERDTTVIFRVSDTRSENLRFLKRKS